MPPLVVLELNLGVVGREVDCAGLGANCFWRSLSASSSSFAAVADLPADFEGALGADGAGCSSLAIWSRSASLVLSDRHQHMPESCLMSNKILTGRRSCGPCCAVDALLCWLSVGNRGCAVMLRVTWEASVRVICCQA